MSARVLAIVSALLLAAFLILRPLASSLGAPQPPDVRGSSRASHPAASGGAAPAPAPETPAAGPSGSPPAAEPASAPTGAAAPLAGPASGPEHARESQEIEQLIFAGTNAERRAAGLTALQPDDVLAAVARAHSADMLRRGFFDHLNLEGESPEDRVTAAHRRLIGLVSENIWEGTRHSIATPAEIAGEIVRGWMHSPGHRANILRRESTHLGVGLAWTATELRATQDFAEARAFLEAPLPARVARGTAVSLLARPLSTGWAAREFDLWSATRGLRASDPAPLAGARIEAEPGSYQVRFYFPLPTPGRLAIVPGPRIEVD